MDDFIELVHEIKPKGNICPRCDGNLESHANHISVCSECKSVFSNGKLISDSWEIAPHPWDGKKTATTVAVEMELKLQYDKVAVYKSVHGFLRVRVIDKKFENVPMVGRVPAINTIIPLKLRTKIAYVLLAPLELHSKLGRDLNNSFINDT